MLRNDGAIIYAIAPSGKRRLVASTAGVIWPRDLGVSNKYCLRTNQFICIAEGGKHGVIGRYRSRYMNDIYQQAVQDVEQSKWDRDRSSKSEMIDGDSENGFRFRPKYPRY